MSEEKNQKEDDVTISNQEEQPEDYLLKYSKTTPKRQYFNSVTGTLMEEYNLDEREMYEVDSDDERELEESQIDQYTDVSEKDKQFYKIWNKFIKHKDKCQIFMESYLLEFVREEGERIINCGLKECLLLHLICLFDYGLINKNEFVNVVEEILQIEQEGIK